MQPDTDDQDFMDGMESLLGMDEEKVQELLDSLDNNSLMALTDAVSKNDKEAAEAIIQSFNGNVSSLFQGEDIDEKDDEKKRPVKPPLDHIFAIGDDVAIKEPNEDTGDDDFVSATVYKPNAPGDTIGVKIKGKPKMVDKDKVYALHEMGVMGMVNVPDIQRMQQLAGIGSVTQEPAMAPVAQPPTSFENPSDSLSQAVCALDQLENVLPNVKLADLKTIRQRLTAMQTQMNESMTAGRFKKRS